MTVRIRHITIDCADPYRLSLFWSAVTGYQEAPNDPNLPTHDQALILAPDGSAGLLFIRVPEPKSVKNRIHFDVQPLDATRDEELERVLALGASQVDDFRRPDGTGWVVVADPEGNEFCIERSPAERTG
ncbi:VOC family protein [Dactylosporangium sp. CS-047395]|uniref:VOC family protein n=1 Tax=Dactylosporangium sp. CS-047395 TaxID=3239936 RepID=UPI003D930381